MNEKIGFVISEYNYDITNTMLQRAREHVKTLGAREGPTVWVAGTFDTPLATKKLLQRSDVDAVVVLGAVIEGETRHDEHVYAHAARKATDLALEFEKPVGLGITGPGMTRNQAMARIDKAKDAVEAVVKLLRALEASEVGKASTTTD